MAIDNALLFSAKQVTGAQTDDDAINIALERLLDLHTTTIDMLVPDGEFLKMPPTYGHVITSEMVENALADEY